MDGGAWWAVVHGVLKSWTERLHFHFSLSCIGEGNGKPPEKIQNLADGKSIFVTGFVESIEYEIIDSCLTVAPVRIAAGIQNKVLVSMGCMIPVIMTSIISSAIPELTDGINCFIKDSAIEIAESCLELMRNPEYRKKIACAGYETVLHNYSWDKKLEGYESLE